MSSNMEEQILQFLDGNLSAKEEEELLHRLAVSPERRTMLRQHLQVRDLVGALATAQRRVVPAALTAGVFHTISALGYNGPEPLAYPASIRQSAAIGEAPSSSVISYWKRPAIISAALVFLLAGIGIGYITFGSASSEKISAQINSSNAVVSTPVAPSNSDNSGASMQTASSDIPGSVAIRHSAPNIHSVATLSSHSRSSNRDGFSNSNTTNSVSSNTTIPTETTNNNSNAPAPTIIVNEPRPQKPATVQKDRPTQDIREPASMTPTSKRPNPLDGNRDRTLTGAKAESQLFSFSIRSGGGKIPGSTQGFNGSLLEVRGTYTALNWLSFTLSAGQFMPYETNAVTTSDPNDPAQRDGSQLLKLSPTLQYKMLAGLEANARFSVLSLPLEFSLGAATDFGGNIIPRFALMTDLALQENIAVRIGVEGMMYSHDVASSLNALEAQYASQHPVLIGPMISKETDGFLGPTVELRWGF